MGNIASVEPNVILIETCNKYLDNNSEIEIDLVYLRGRSFKPYSVFELTNG